MLLQGLFSVTVCQSLFIAPCSHVFHYKCIRPLLLRHHPGFSCPLCRTFADLEADVEEDEAWQQALLREAMAGQQPHNVATPGIEEPPEPAAATTTAAGSAGQAAGTTPSVTITSGLDQEAQDQEMRDARRSASDAEMDDDDEANDSNDADGTQPMSIRLIDTSIRDSSLETARTPMNQNFLSILAENNGSINSLAARQSAAAQDIGAGSSAAAAAAAVAAASAAPFARSPLANEIVDSRRPSVASQASHPRNSFHSSHAEEFGTPEAGQSPAVSYANLRASAGAGGTNGGHSSGSGGASPPRTANDESDEAGGSGSGHRAAEGAEPLRTPKGKEPATDSNDAASASYFGRVESNDDSSADSSGDTSQGKLGKLWRRASGALGPESR